MFNENSQMVKNFVFLIEKGMRGIDDVPDFQNLRELVKQCLQKSEN